MVSFINTSEIPGLTMVMVNVAAALIEQEKRVTLVDASNGYKGRPGRDNISSKQEGRVILEVDTADNGPQEAGLETLPSGIRVLHVDDVFDDINGASETSLDLIQKIGKSNDYILVDLLLKPNHFTTSMLKSSDLVIILSDYRIDSLVNTRNTVTLLNFLGITAEKMAVVLADPEGKNQNLTAANMKAFVEANLGIMLVEVVSFDAKMYQLFYLDSQPVIQSNPNQKLAQDLKRIARYIATYSYTGQEPKQTKKATPPAEVKIDADK